MLMSMFSFRNCTDPSHNRNRTPAGWLPRKFIMLPIIFGGAAPPVSAAGLGWPLLALPEPVKSSAIGGPPAPESHVLTHVLNVLGMNARPAPPKTSKLSVTGFLFICSIVQANGQPPSPPAKDVT